MTGSAYLLVSALLNSLVKSVHTLLIFYIASGIFGLCTAFMFHERGMDDLTRFLSMATVLGGLLATSWTYYLGLGMKGVVGPTWVIFLVAALRLWQLTPSRGRMKRMRRKSVSLIMMLLMMVSLAGAPLLHILGQAVWVMAVAYVIIVVLGAFVLGKR